MVEKIFILVKVYKIIDFIMDHWGQIAPWVPGVALLTSVLSVLWAGLSQLQSVEIVVIAMLTVLVTLIGLTLLPDFFNKWFPRPFAVHSPGYRGLHDATHSHLYVKVEIFNRTHNKLSLKYALHLQPEKGHRRRYIEPQLEGVKEQLDGDEHVKGILIFNVGSLTNDPSWIIKETSLSVTDIRSRRAVRIPIATQQSQYPPGQFDYD